MRTLTFLTVVSVCPLLMLPAPAFGTAEVGLVLSPTHLTPTVAAGDETVETITLQNESAEDMRIMGRVDYGQDQRDGRPVVGLAPDELSLKPGESGQVQVHIAVPPETESGRRLAVALFNAVPASGGNIAIVSQISSLVDIEVIHPVDEVSWALPFVLDSSAPVSFQVEARNSGNFPTDLTEKADLHGLAGTVHLESPSKSVTVGDRTTLVIPWEDSPWLTVKRATFSVGSAVGAPVQKTAFFIILPWKLLLAALLILMTSYTGFRILRNR